MIEVNNGDGNNQKKNDNPTSFDNNITMKNFNEITKEVIDRENVDDFDEIDSGKIAFIEILTNLDEYPEDFMVKLLHAFIKNADTRIKESLINSFGEFEEFIQILTIMLENIRPET